MTRKEAIMPSLLVINQGRRKKRKKTRKNPDLLVVNPNAQMPATLVITLLGLGGLMVCGAVCGPRKPAAPAEKKPPVPVPEAAPPAGEEEVTPGFSPAEGSIWA
jgi:hypothetical protein